VEHLDAHVELEATDALLAGQEDGRLTHFVGQDRVLARARHQQRIRTHRHLARPRDSSPLAAPL
jgi:hypothetical protein